MKSRTKTNKASLQDAYQSVRVWQMRALAIGVMLYSLVSGLAQEAPIITFSAPGAGQGMFALNISEEARAAAAKAAATRSDSRVQSLTVPPPTAVGTFVTFDVPGAVNGTSPAGINNGGAITGGYGDNIGSGAHGFIRAANGFFVTFDVPGAVNGTSPSAINNDGIVTGSYFDNIGSGAHGFIRAANGFFVTFDVPGAVNGTSPSAINNDGIVTGSYFDNIGSGAHGFIRAANGSIVSFDAPSGGFIFGSSAINARGEVAGNYFDVNFIQHSFLREPNGALATFDPPGAVNGSFPSTITPDGVILGVYFDVDFNSHGFLRDSSGSFTEISGPGGLAGQNDPFTLSFGAVLSINPGGEIAGTYFEPMAGNPLGGDYRVFLLSKHGQYTTFDAANYPPCCIFSSPLAINPAGTVTGILNDGFSVYRGFLRTSDGAVTVFDAPGAGRGRFQGTVTIGMTPGGVVAGVYVGPNDGNFLGDHHGHGFLFQPR
jgi:hypothetical protein